MTRLQPGAPAEPSIARSLGGRPGTCLLMGAAAVGLIAAFLLGAPLVSVFLAGLLLICPLLAWSPLRYQRRAVSGAARGRGGPRPVEVVVVTSPSCHLCEDALAALAELAAEFRTAFRVPVTFEVRGGPAASGLAGEALNHVCQVVREALTNAVRHGRPRRVQVVLERGREGLRIEVADNGRGFLPEAAATGKGLGLRNMRQRALLLGGSLDVESRPGRGTRVVLTLPVSRGGKPS